LIPAVVQMCESVCRVHIYWDTSDYMHPNSTI
jgi:hypothetical protein